MVFIILKIVCQKWVTMASTLCPCHVQLKIKFAKIDWATIEYVLNPYICLRSWSFLSNLPHFFG